MPSGIQLSTAGITLNYAVEATAGERPTAGYTKVPEVKAIPTLDPAPDTLETTTLEETVWKTYIQGLKDPGGTLDFTANLTVVLMKEWDKVMTAYNTAAASNLHMWWCILIPGLEKAFYFTGQPAELGGPGAEVSSVLEITLHIAPGTGMGWYDKPTAAVGV